MGLSLRSQRLFPFVTSLAVLYLSIHCQTSRNTKTAGNLTLRNFRKGTPMALRTLKQFNTHFEHYHMQCTFCIRSTVFLRLKPAKIQKRSRHGTHHDWSWYVPCLSPVPRISTGLILRNMYQLNMYQLFCMWQLLRLSLSPLIFGLMPHLICFP